MAVSQQEKCYGLAIEGGGDHGAWEAGALLTMHKHYKQSYDVFSGVSIGAINSLFLSSFSKEEGLQAVEELKAIWLNITSKDVYVSPNPFNLIGNLIFRSGILDNSPEADLLKGIMKNRGGKIRRPVTVGVTDATDGKKKEVDLDKLVNIDDALMWTKASTSIPALFQSMKIDDKIYIDGGVV